MIRVVKGKGKQKMNTYKAEVFLSYCWKNDDIANMIEQHFKSYGHINMHRDKIDIGNWGSIKEYMHSISKMDFTILLISKEYLESSNCMYEILEVMRDRDYREKIFPAVIDTTIYSPSGRAQYVKHWQDEYAKLSESLNGIATANLGRLSDDLKRIQDIAANVAIFLDTVADMNNPQIKEVNIAIENKLKEQGIFSQGVKANVVVDGPDDILKRLNITSNPIRKEFTDLDKNRFITSQYVEINSLLQQLFKQIEAKNTLCQIETETIDSRNTVYTFYRAGQLSTSIKIFLSNMLDSNLSIGISQGIHSTSNNSWNGNYSVEVIDGTLVLRNFMSMTNRQCLTNSEEVVKDIWDTYIDPYLRR